MSTMMTWLDDLHGYELRCLAEAHGLKIHEDTRDSTVRQAIRERQSMMDERAQMIPLIMAIAKAEEDTK